MLTFTLELRDPERNLRGAETLHVESARQVWPHVVLAARGLKEPAGIRIRVMDATGGIVVLTGAAAALHSSDQRISA